MQYSRFTSGRLDAKCAKYWDQMYRDTEIFLDWKVTQAAIEYHIPLIQEELGLGYKAARNLVWNAYCDAITGDVQSPFFEEYEHLCDVIPDDLMPLFTLAQTVGVDIHGGATRRQAEKAFQSWLAEDPENGDFGQYRINSDLSIVKVR